MKVLVTGGLGFLGSHLVDLLKEENHEVWIVDNLSSNAIEPSPSPPTIIADVDKWIYSAPVFDVIYHCASPVGPTGVLKHAGNIGKKILDDIVSLRTYCIEHDCLLIDISTSEVYGYDGDLKENSNKVFRGDYQIRTEYGAAKMLAEMALINRAKVCASLRFQIIRPFNIAGSRQKPDGGFVLPRFVVAALTHQPVTIYGDGKQNRSFTHVKDVANAIYKVSQLNTYNEIWNVGCEENKRSIEELAGYVASSVTKFGIKTVDIKYVNPKELHGGLFSEVPDKISNSDKLRSIGWLPKTRVEDIVEEVVDYYNNKIVTEGYYFKVW